VSTALITSVMVISGNMARKDVFLLCYVRNITSVWKAGTLAGLANLRKTKRECIQITDITGGLRTRYESRTWWVTSTFNCIWTIIPDFLFFRQPNSSVLRRLPCSIRSAVMPGACLLYESVFCVRHLACVLSSQRTLRGVRSGMEHLKPPEALTLSAATNKAEAWRRWKMS